MSSADLVWKRGDESMEAFGRTIGCSCPIRSLANGQRGVREVVYTTTRSGKEGYPYDPQMFPIGLWLLIKVEVTDPPDPYLGPKFIRTDAHQKVERWSTVQRDELCYDAPLGLYAFDYGYLIHYSSGDYTLGCLKITSLDEQLLLCDRLEYAIEEQRDMMLEVVA